MPHSDQTSHSQQANCIVDVFLNNFVLSRYYAADHVQTAILPEAQSYPVTYCRSVIDIVLVNNISVKENTCIICIIRGFTNRHLPPIRV